MTTRILALFALPLLACGHNVHYEGQLLDESGAPQRGMAVQIAGLQFERNAPTTTDAIARMEPTASATTDDDGQFAVDQYVGGGFGCGDSDGSDPSLVIAPEGAAGRLLIADSDFSHTNELGALHLPPVIGASVSESDLDVAWPGTLPDGAIVRVDGQGWFASSALPLTALSPCGTPESCSHTVALAWTEGSVHARSAEVHVDATAPTPIVDKVSTFSTVTASFDAPMDISAIYVDAVFAENDSDTGSPSLSFTSVGDPLVPEPIKSSQCTRYGTGLACSGIPGGRVASITVSGVPGLALRVFGGVHRDRRGLALGLSPVVGD